MTDTSRPAPGPPAAPTPSERERGRGGARRQRPVPEEWLASIAPLQYGSGLTAWVQIHNDVRARITGGALAPGDELPSEPALAKAYAVSRLTIRRVFAELARAGYIRTEHGVGSYVAPVLMRHRIDDGHVSLLESMASRGHSVRQLVLDVHESDVASATMRLGHPHVDGAPEPTSFADFPGPLMAYRYIRWVDEIPWSHSYAVVPAALAPPSWDGAISLFAAISEVHGFSVRRDERSFSAVAADEEDARWLEVPVGAPLLLLKGTNTDEKGRPIARIVHRIRSDRAEYSVRVPR